MDAELDAAKCEKYSSIMFGAMLWQVESRRHAIMISGQRNLHNLIGMDTNNENGIIWCAQPILSSIDRFGNSTETRLSSFFWFVCIYLGHIKYD